jgi:hypothetical protein
MIIQIGDQLELLARQRHALVPGKPAAESAAADLARPWSAS